jgi:DNA modification methylase
LAVADNRSSQVSLDWDTETLKGLVEDGVDLAPFWTADELAAMWPQTVDLLTDEDDVPPVPVEPVSKLGDLYILGNHRLLCGDSTVLADVERLMGGAKAVCMWTDPPYGVDYTGKTKKALKIENDSSAGLVEMLHEAFACATVALESGAAVYVAHPPGALSVTFGEAFLATGWRLHQTLVWDKGTIVMGHSDYHYSHEPIYFGYTQSTAGRYGRGGKGWYGDNSQKSILSFPKPSRSEEHPTMKPVALIEHCLGNSTQTGTAVLDLFGGSGSTLIACEKTGRRCYMMELSPAYTDVICKRWEQATGKKAVLSAG